MFVLPKAKVCTVIYSLGKGRFNFVSCDGPGTDFKFKGFEQVV